MASLVTDSGAMSGHLDKGAPSRAKQDPDGCWWVGGVYVGRKLTETLFAEPVAAARHLIRSTARDPSFAVRLGEVFGPNNDCMACTMRGDFVANDRTLVGAARHLQAHENANSSK